MRIPDEARRLALEGDKIRALQLLRRATGIGLAEAKEIIDIFLAGGYVELADRATELGEDRTCHIERKLAAIERAISPIPLDPSAVCRRLLDIIQADEELLDIVHATYGSQRGLMVGTRNRLLFIGLESPALPKLEQFPLNNIYLVHHIAGPSASSMKIFMLGFSKAVFTNLDTVMARSFAQRIGYNIVFRTDEASLFEGWDRIDYLEALYDNGVITGDELNEGRERAISEVQRPGKGSPKGGRPS